MVKIEYINPGTLVAGPYTPATKVGNLVFVSGQAPAKGTTDIRDQTLSVLENVKKVLEAAGAKVSDVVKTSVFLNDIEDYEKMNQTYKEFFQKNGVTENFPARTTVEVANLPLKGMLVEIDVIAALHDSQLL